MRTSDAAQVKPEPNAASITREPSPMRPSCFASWKAMPMEAAVVFPYFWMLCTTLSGGKRRTRATISLIRMFAWWGTSTSTSSRP